MKTIRIALASVALAAALSACGSGGAVSTAAADSAAPSATGSAAPSGTAAPDAAATADAAAVETVFRGYYEALIARDFATACTLNAPETTAKMLENLKAQGLTAATCEEAFTTIYAIPGAAEAADGIARSAEIQDITVNGDDATITWSAEVQGQRPTVTNGVRRIDGQWRLLDTSS
jgi:ABC-type transport system substrate-binding protein